jgi:hypothetical protein
MSTAVFYFAAQYSHSSTPNLKNFWLETNIQKNCPQGIQKKFRENG